MKPRAIPMRAAFLAFVVASTFALGSPARAQPDTTFGSGTLEVGTDIAPGTYQTLVPDNSAGCYWARLAGFEGDLDSILANDNLDPGDLATVTILPSDVGFESSRCGTWQLSEEVGPAEPVDEFGGGTWIVAEDIQPGTYRSTVPDNSAGCYWARLAGFEGDLDSILANDNVEPGDRITVVITQDDAGFQSSGCGEWAKRV